MVVKRGFTVCSSDVSLFLDDFREYSEFSPSLQVACDSRKAHYVTRDDYV